jgi:hypothetical protein
MRLCFGVSGLGSNQQQRGQSDGNSSKDTNNNGALRAIRAAEDASKTDNAEVPLTKQQNVRKSDEGKTKTFRDFGLFGV